MVKIIAVSVLFALTVGCAKSSDNNAAGAPAAAPAPAPKGPTPPSSPVAPGEKKSSDDKKGPVAPKTPSQQEAEEDDGDEVGPDEKPAPKKPANPVAPAPAKPRPVAPAKPKPVSPGPVGPGGVNPGPDAVGPAAVNEANVMEIKAFLADRVLNANDPAVRDRNLKAARQIVNLEVIGNDLTKDLRVLIGLQGAKKPVALGGIRSHGKAELVQMEGPNFAPVRKGFEAKGLLLCLDYQIKGRCFTSLLRLELGGAGARATVFAISRKTNAALALGRVADNLNPAARKIVALFDNTKQVAEQRRRQGLRGADVCKAGVKNVIRSTLVESYDVIHGGSNFNLSLLTCEREVIVLNSPFLPAGSLAAVGQTPVPLAAFPTPRLGSLIDILRNQARDREIVADPGALNEKTAGAKFNLQHAIAEGKLTRFSEQNGALGVQLRLKSAQQRPSDLVISFKRRTLPMAGVRGVESLLRSNPVR